MSKIAFDAVVFLRTDKEEGSAGHPVDRIELSNFVIVSYIASKYAPNAIGFNEFSKDIDEAIDKFLWQIFDAKVIFGNTLPIDTNDTSERHAVRVSDIRNIVVLACQETKLHHFEMQYDITF